MGITDAVPMLLVRKTHTFPHREMNLTSKISISMPVGANQAQPYNDFWFPCQNLCWQNCSFSKLRPRYSNRSRNDSRIVLYYSDLEFLGRISRSEEMGMKSNVRSNCLGFSCLGWQNCPFSKLRSRYSNRPRNDSRIVLYYSDPEFFGRISRSEEMGEQEKSSSNAFGFSYLCWQNCRFSKLRPRCSNRPRNDSLIVLNYSDLEFFGHNYLEI